MPMGAITRGTTGTNRLRRVDRWIAAHPAVRTPDAPLVVDLGYGASAVTPLELERRLRPANAGVEVVGLEIDPARVAVAREQLALVRAGRTSFSPDAAVRFEHGGFETPLPRGRRADVIRAFNVLRQYDEADVAAAWATMVARLEPGGVLVEGTCDEIGRVCTWIDIGHDGPRSLTLSLRLRDLERPGIAAERLPKALIHRNVEGEGVHAFLSELDRAWQLNAALGVYSPGQRFLASVSALRASGWPVRADRRRARYGEVGVAWSAVAPLS